MGWLPIQKRPNDLFVSYGHADRNLVDPLVNWLRRLAGLKVWYDATSGDSSKRTTAVLADAIQASRGALFVLSSNWMASSWCRDEHEFALTEVRADNSYLLLAVRVEDVDIPPWFRIANVIDFRRFDAGSAADLLRSMALDPPTRYDNEQDVYFSGPWSRPSKAVSPTLDSLHQMGWRLVGDSPDHPHFQDATTRISSIIGTARGLIGLLPFDVSKPPYNTSPWIIEEVRIAQRLGKPCLLLAEADVQIPPELASQAFGGRAIQTSNEGPNVTFRKALADFDEELARRPHTDAHSYSFLVNSLLNEQSEMDNLVSVVERASNMTCVLGLRLSGQHVQRAIVERIRTAGFVIADVTADKRNSLIEAGIAIGAGTPLHLLCRPPSDGSFKRRFMFEDREMNWYLNPVERLGLAYRLGRIYRRRIFARH